MPIPPRQLIAEVTRAVTRPSGYEAMMRVRTSTGIRPTDFYGAFSMNNTTDVEFAGIDSDKSTVVRIRHDDKLPENGECHFQAALLYVLSMVAHPVVGGR